MLKVRFVGRGMQLEFWYPSYRTIITSRIVEIRAKASLRNKLSEKLPSSYEEGLRWLQPARGGGPRIERSVQSRSKPPPPWPLATPSPP